MRILSWFSVIICLTLLLVAGGCQSAIAGDITLTWDAVTAADLAGYNIYQAERQGDKTTAWGIAVIVDALTTTATVTVDETKNWAWLVTAFDTSGNKSFVSNMVELRDESPPMTPANLEKQ